MGTRFRERGFSSGGKIVGSDGFSQNDIIWEVDFRRFPLSNGTNAGYHTSLLSSKGLTLARASSATVQTSTSTVVTTDIGVDAPRIGDAGYGHGFVIEETRENKCVNSRNVTTLNGWGAAGAGSTTQDAETGVDGTQLVDSHSVASNYGPFTPTAGVSVAAGAKITATFWVKRRAGTGSGTMQAALGISGVGAGSVTVTRTIGETWEKVTLTATNATAGAVTYYLTPWEGRAAAAATPPISAQTLDYLVDLVNVELSVVFGTEGIITTGALATRAVDNLTLDTNARIVRNGRAVIEMRFVAKSASTNDNYQALIDIEGTGGANSVVMFMLTGALRVGPVQSTNTFAYSFGDVVDLFMEWGNGVPYAKIRKNGGAVTTLALTATVAPKLAAGSPKIFNGTGTNRASGWIQQIRVYTPGKRPAWAA
jgi:hypothetical protein